eukprot:761907-Amphidinium_carterae.1
MLSLLCRSLTPIGSKGAGLPPKQPSDSGVAVRETCTGLVIRGDPDSPRDLPRPVGLAPWSR